MAGEILPRKNIAEFNQALMELGSLVCKPGRPVCDECPIKTQCAACRAGLQSKIPAPKQKTPLTDLHEVAIVVTKKKTVLLRQCVEGERWAGLWDFPRFAIEATSREPSSFRSTCPPLTDNDIDHAVHDEIVEKVYALTGITCLPGSLLQTIKHGVTRYRITLDCYTAQYALGRIRPTTAQPVRWARLEELGQYALSTTGRKIARSIASPNRAAR
jgi:A/G-specific adenine glycosylase